MQTLFRELGMPLAGFERQLNLNDMATVYVDCVGVNELVAASKKPEARMLKNWLFSQVLPSLVRVGISAQSEGVLPKQSTILERLAPVLREWVSEKRRSIHVPRPGVSNVYLMLARNAGSAGVWIKWGESLDFDFTTHHRAHLEVVLFLVEPTRDHHFVTQAFGTDLLTMGAEVQNELCRLTDDVSLPQLASRMMELIAQDRFFETTVYQEFIGERVVRDKNCCVPVVEIMGVFRAWKTAQRGGTKGWDSSRKGSKLDADFTAEGSWNRQDSTKKKAGIVSNVTQMYKDWRRSAKHKQFNDAWETQRQQLAMPDHVKYMPGQPGYEEAINHYESLSGRQ
ncbi:hypothetical protein WJX72_008801 [[Myrmecia] bisecta]|uniref:Bro-N domain-containing protein n=1 Tax=[Myrmecia] bisecta TaxID=41462 RepID=A0AAW1Q7G9_9CHLO